MTGEYDDIINMPHHVSANHRPMPLINRAAQFGSFSALTGHSAAIRETARLTNAAPELDNEEYERLNRTLSRILCWKNEQPPMVSITYFVPDDKKRGGCFCKIEGIVEKVKADDAIIVMNDGTSIAFCQIVKLSLISS